MKFDTKTAAAYAGEKLDSLLQRITRDTSVQHVEHERGRREKRRRVERRWRLRREVDHGAEHARNAACCIAQGQEIRELEIAEHREVTLTFAGAHDPAWAASPARTNIGSLNMDLMRTARMSR